MPPATRHASPSPEFLGSRVGQIVSKGFDAIAFMRSRREEIDREDEGLAWEERARKTRELLSKDPLWLYLKGRLAEPLTLEPTVVSDKPR
jgi:hypothetical protein